MDNEQEQQELWWASLYVKDADIAHSIKTATLDFVEKREAQSSSDHNNPQTKQLRTLILSCEWTRGNPFTISAEKFRNEINEIQGAIVQHKMDDAVLAALTEWKNNFLRDRQQKGLSEFTPAYLSEQRENYEVGKQYGIHSVFFSFFDFSASLDFHNYLSNKQAIIWLQNFSPLKANAPIAITVPDKPETESQATTPHTGNTRTQHHAGPNRTKFSQTKMSQYNPTEQELIAELCKARECDWENAYTRQHQWNQGESSDYGTYLKGVAINFPAPPLLHMLTPTEWREKPLTFIINQIQTSPEEYRNTIKNIIDRYKTAARKKLIDIAHRQWLACSTNSPENTSREKKFKKYSDAPILDNSDIPAPNIKYNAPRKNGEPGEPYNHGIVYDFLDNLLEEAELVKKIITLQELQKHLDKASQQQPQHAPKQKQTTSTTPELIDQPTADICKTYQLDTLNVVMNLHHAAEACIESQNKRIESARERITIADRLQQTGKDPLSYGYDKNRDEKQIESAECQRDEIEPIRTIGFSHPPKECIAIIAESSKLFCSCIQGLELLEQNFKTEHPDFWVKKEHDGDYIDNVMKSYTRSRSRAVEHATVLKWLELQSAKQWLLTGFDEMLKTKKPTQSAATHQNPETPAIIIEKHRTTMSKTTDRNAAFKKTALSAIDIYLFHQNETLEKELLQLEDITYRYDSMVERGFKKSQDWALNARITHYEQRKEEVAEKLIFTENHRSEINNTRQNIEQLFETSTPSHAMQAIKENFSLNTNILVCLPWLRATIDKQRKEDQKEPVDNLDFDTVKTLWETNKQRSYDYQDICLWENINAAENWLTGENPATVTSTDNPIKKEDEPDINKQPFSKRETDVSLVTSQKNAESEADKKKLKPGEWKKPSSLAEVIPSYFDNHFKGKKEDIVQIILYDRKKGPKSINQKEYLTTLHIEYCKEFGHEKDPEPISLSYFIQLFKTYKRNM